MIIERTLNDLFKDGHDVIISSQMAVIILMENDDCEITVSEKSRLKVVIAKRSLFGF